jgi:hypothetical protein
VRYKAGDSRIGTGMYTGPMVAHSHLPRAGSCLPSIRSLCPARRHRDAPLLCAFMLLGEPHSQLPSAPCTMGR